MKEKRIFKRYDKELPFVIKTAAEQSLSSITNLRARTMNISAGGCAFYYCIQIPVRSDIEVFLQIKNKLFAVKGNVIRKEERANGQFIYAIKFQFENDGQQDQLDLALREGLDEYSLNFTREYPRIEINLPSTYQEGDDSNVKTISITNFSPIGAKLHTKEPINEKILLHLPNFPFYVWAKKVWERKEGHGYSVGVEFVELTPKLVSKLKEYVLNDIRRFHLEQRIEQQIKLVSLKD